MNRLGNLASQVCASALLCVPFLHAAPLVRSGETVAFMGDSITQQGADTPGGYVRLVVSGLAANGMEIKIIPAGISGHKSDQMRDRLELDVLSKNPDWMTLSCGVNDVWHGASGVSLDDYKINISDIVDRCQQAGIKVMILTSTQIQLPQDNANNLTLANYNDFLREIARERALPLADLSLAMAADQQANEAGGLTKSLTSDGVHMNHLGNLMMARGVLRTFGLDDAQLAVAETSWRMIPDAVPLSAKCGISLPEMEVIEMLATKRNQSASDLLCALLKNSITSLVSESDAGKESK